MYPVCPTGKWCYFQRAPKQVNAFFFIFVCYIFNRIIVILNTETKWLKKFIEVRSHAYNLSDLLNGDNEHSF